MVGRRFQSRCVRQEPGEDAGANLKVCERIVNVDEIFQTHDAVSGCFRDGRSFQELIHALNDGAIDPIVMGKNKINMFEINI